MPSDSKTKSSKKKVWQIVGLAAAALVVVAGGILFVGAASGWFSQSQVPAKITISKDFVQGEPDAERKITVNTAEFDKLLAEKKTFIGISHLPTCTANVMSYIADYAKQHGLMYVYYPWAELRETALHDKIKFAPSVFVVSNGELVDFLAADSNQDVAKYNDYAAFSAWLDKYF